MEIRKSAFIDAMRTVGPILGILLAFILNEARAAESLPPIVWWRLVEVVDEHTLKLHSDQGETQTITLACIGSAKDNRATIAYITNRLRDRKLDFWPLETGQTNWYERPMCLILDMDLPRGGDAVYDFPTLNEELLAWGYAPFMEVKITADPYNLKERLLRAKAEGEKHQKEQQVRWKKLERQQ